MAQPTKSAPLPDMPLSRKEMMLQIRKCPPLAGWAKAKSIPKYEEKRRVNSCVHEK